MMRALLPGNGIFRKLALPLLLAMSLGLAGCGDDGDDGDPGPAGPPGADGSDGLGIFRTRT